MKKRFLAVLTAIFVLSSSLGLDSFAGYEEPPNASDQTELSSLSSQEEQEEGQESEDIVSEVKDGESKDNGKESDDSSLGQKEETEETTQESKEQDIKESNEDEKPEESLEDISAPEEEPEDATASKDELEDAAASKDELEDAAASKDELEDVAASQEKPGDLMVPEEKPEAISGGKERKGAEDTSQEPLSVEPEAPSKETKSRESITSAPEIGVSNFVYMEKEYVSLSETQNILVSAGKSGEKMKEATLSYHKEGSGEKFTAKASAISGDTALFSMAYTSASGIGVYVLDEILYTTEQGQQFVADLTVEQTMKYGVETRVDAQPDARVVDPEINGNVVTFDADGNQESETSIADALKYAGAEATVGAAAMESGGQRAYGAAGNAKASGGMVIVLDPGHGGSDPGATRTYNGITYYERDINLKIATYCKKELETYAGVTVYMTRTDNTSQLMDRWERTQFALSKGADVIVSLHINSTGEQSTSVSGSLVYVPNNDTASGSVSQELARKILEKLSQLGLQDRGLLLDEGLGMIKYPKENGVPGILVEHAFVNNAGDVAKYLSSDAKLKKLGVADATGIANYYKLKKKNSKYTDYEDGAGSLQVKANKEKTKYTVNVSGVDKAYGVQFAVWSDAGGQGGMKWYTAKKNTKGVWTGSFQVKTFRKKGIYNIHVYIDNQDGTSVFSGSTAVKVDGVSAKKVAAETIKRESGTFRVRVTGLKSGSPITKVTVKAWSQSNKKNAYTYTAKLQKNGSYLTTVNIKNHKYLYGTYQLQITASDKNGLTKTWKKSVKFKQPSLGMQAKANGAQTKVTITSKSLPGIKSARIAVWSSKNGQDDLKWYKAKKNKKGQWSITVKISNHKEAGTYYAHMYGKRSSKQEVFMTDTTFEVTAPSIKQVAARNKNAKAGTFYVEVKGIQAKAGVKKVTVKAWSKKNKKDAHTYVAKKMSNGNYRIKVNIKNHNNNYGTYQLTAYVKDSRGIVKTKTAACKFSKSK